MAIEPGVMRPQSTTAKDRQVSEARTEAWGGFSLKASGGNSPANSLISHVRPPKQRESTFLLF